jgi:hypothetical protein
MMSTWRGINSPSIRDQNTYDNKAKKRLFHAPISYSIDNAIVKQRQVNLGYGKVKLGKIKTER